MSSQEWCICQNSEKMPTRRECASWNEILEVKAFHFKGKARVSWNTASLEFTEAVFQRCSSKWVFLKILLYSQENTCVGVYFK